MARLKKNDPAVSAGMADSVPTPGGAPSNGVLLSVYDAARCCLAYDEARQILKTTDRAVAEAAAAQMVRGIICPHAELSDRIAAGFPVKD